MNYEGQWQNFSELANSQIELASQGKIPSISVEFQQKRASINFSNMTASVVVPKSSFFGTSSVVNFAVRRRDAYEEKLLDSLHQPKVAVKVNKETKDLRAVFTALKEDLPQGLQFYQQQVERLTCEESVQIDNLTPDLSDELDQIGLKFGVEVFSKDHKSVVVKGLVRPVAQALKAVMELLRTSSTASHEKPPDSWTVQSDPTAVALINVSQGTPEWTSIETRMKATLPTAHILKIQRVQNLWQWQKYVFLRDRLAKRHEKSTSHETLLFHGTRQNDPSLIHNGDDGFDMRFSQAGMWGKGSYFAVNARYSHDYCYTLSSGNTRQMFSAKVAIGKSVELASKADLIKPPEGYDSVTGQTNGSVVYIVYENGRAYPEHLITYQA